MYFPQLQFFKLIKLSFKFKYICLIIYLHNCKFILYALRFSLKKSTFISHNCDFTECIF